MYVYGHKMLLLLLLQRKKNLTISFFQAHTTHTPQTACSQSLMHRKSRGRTQEKEQQTNKQQQRKPSILSCALHHSSSQDLECKVLPSFLLSPSLPTPR
jgi:hypothetical protein